MDSRAAVAEAVTAGHVVELRPRFARRLGNALTAAWPAELARTVKRPQLEGEAHNPAKGWGARRDYQIIDHDAIAGGWPDPLCLVAMATVAGAHDILADLPLEKNHSSVCLKRYHDGGGQGWHYDGNDITALLYLNTPAAGGGTLIDDGTGQPLRVAPESGKLIIFAGRFIRHAAEDTPGEKVVAIVNLYRPGMFATRPEGLDADILGQ